jgi:hypothetical protein
MAINISGYATGTVAGATGGNTPSETTDEYWGLERLKRSYLDYLISKTDEVEEQKDSRRYRHASQWTSEQVKIFNKRKQPIVTYNRIGRKIDGVIGLIEKLKQSPKAFPRTPNEEASADLATAVVRSVLDEAEWKSKSYLAAQNAAVDGFGGIELLLEQGDQGDPQVTFEVVENDGFFYDPRSVKLDFSDCRYMGQGKWFDLDAARDLFPNHADDLEDGIESATDLSTNSDRENKWFITDGSTKRIRIVDEWYMMNGEWCWCIYTGNKKLEEGKGYFHDEKKKTLCKYLMFSAAVDQDGDRYGFIRNLKSAQDEINQRRSKALHLLNTRRIIAEQGAFDDVEITRREAARPDGVVIRNKGFEAEFDDGSKNQEIQAHLEFLVDAKAEIENFGPNPALIGQGSLGDKSGRAIQLLQQAGVAELGPFLLAYRGWKIRIYRAIWNAVKEHWTAERYIRVTDDQETLQWVGINQVTVDPMTGLPAMSNQVSNLDVDIIMDEGPDSITTLADTYEGLLAIAQQGTQLPPEILIELNPGLDHDTKKRILDKLKQPNPQAEIQMEAMKAEIQKILAEAGLAQAKAVDTMRGDQGGPQEHPMVTLSQIENTQADTSHKKAQALKTMIEAQLAPQEAAHQQQMDQVGARQTEEQNQHQRGMDKVGAVQTEQQNAHQRGMDQEQAVQGRAKMALDKDKSDKDRAQGAYESERDARQSAYEGERDARQNAHDSEQDRAVSMAQSRESNEVAREGNQMKAGDTPKKKKKKSGGVNISLDGTMASQLNEGAKQNSMAMAGVASVMAQATQMLAQAAKSMAQSSDKIADAVSKPKKVMRDKTGRISGVE